MPPSPSCRWRRTAGCSTSHGGWSQLIDGTGPAGSTSAPGPRSRASTGRDRVEVRTRDGVLVADHVVVATGGPAAVRRLLPADPGMGRPRTAADRGMPRPRGQPGSRPRLCALPRRSRSTSPCSRHRPARLPRARRWWPPSATAPGAPTRTARSSSTWSPRPAWQPGEVVTSRFLAHLPVTGAIPRAATGGMAGRPAVEDTGVCRGDHGR